MGEHATHPTRDRIEELEKALRDVVYEITHLSQRRDDGSHECRISARTLARARAAIYRT